jgi:hypothetical protein
MHSRCGPRFPSTTQLTSVTEKLEGGRWDTAGFGSWVDMAPFGLIHRTPAMDPVTDALVTNDYNPRPLAHLARVWDPRKLPLLRRVCIQQCWIGPPLELCIPTVGIAPPSSHAEIGPLVGGPAPSLTTRTVAGPRNRKRTTEPSDVADPLPLCRVGVAMSGRMLVVKIRRKSLVQTLVWRRKRPKQGFFPSDSIH